MRTQLLPAIFAMLVSTVVWAAPGTGSDTACETIHLNVELTICEGDTIVVAGAARWSAGTWTDTIFGSNGCDTIRTTTLHVNPTVRATQDQFIYICYGDSVQIGNRWISTTGCWNDTLTSSTGCDSIVKLFVYRDVFHDSLMVDSNGIRQVYEGYTNRQWYRNDTLLVGDTLSWIYPTKSGMYCIRFTYKMPTRLAKPKYCTYTSCMYYTVPSKSDGPKPKGPGLKVYPTPNNGRFEVKVSEGAIDHLRIFSPSGRQVVSLSPATHRKVLVDLSDQQPGVYVVSATTVSGEVVAAHVLIE